MAVTKPGYMLEHPSIQRYEFVSQTCDMCVTWIVKIRLVRTISRKPKTRRSQLDPSWIVGFVDGEGCFSVSIHRNKRYARRTGGWQLTPVIPGVPARERA